MLYYLLFWMFMGFIIHFYIIFGTNLLTQSPLPVSVFPCFRVSQKRKIKRSPIDLKLHGTYFLNKRDPKDLEWTSSNQRGGHEAGGAPTPWARPPPSWAPRSSTDLLLPPIYTYVPPNHQQRSQNPISTAATFCTREIPSWGLFRRSA